MIQRYYKPLVSVAEVAVLQEVTIRHFHLEADSDAWIALHQRAFSASRSWSRRQFMREFCHKPWWDSTRMWFAVDSVQQRPLGTVCLGEKRSPSEAPIGTVLWLAVDPDNRRRGIARALLHHLEQDARRREYQRLELETLDQWQAANRFYQALGYIRF